MLLSWLSKLLASLLTASLCGIIITLTLSQTLMSSHYLEGQLNKTNSYNRLSTALSTEVAKQAGLASNPQVNTLIQGILTPAVLKQKINSALDQLQAYYRGNGATPVIDLSDLASQAQAAGVPLGQNNPLSQPITLGSNSAKASATAKGVSKTFDHVRLTTIITSLVLVVALLAVSWERHRYGALPDVLICVGVLIGLVALIFDLGPSLADHYIKLSSTSNAFAALGHDLAESIARDLARRFGIIAAACLVAGIVTRILAGRLQGKAATTPVKPVSSKSPKMVLN
jgi:hypothetical protein